MYCPVVIMSPDIELRERRKALQQWSLCVANDFVLNQVCVYHERLYAYNVVSKFWFVRSFSSQHYSKFSTDITSENVSQIRTRERKTRSFICKVNFNFLRSSRHLWYSFRSDCVLLEKECSWLQQYPYWKGKDQVPDSKILTTLKVSCQKT